VTNFDDNTVSVLATSCNVLQLLELSPSTVQVGASFTLQIVGTGFGSDATVNFGTTTGLVPTSITPGLITITRTAPTTARPILVPVPSRGRTSNPLFLSVISGPPLALSQVSPATATADGQDLMLTLDGQQFVPSVPGVSGSLVLFGGQGIVT